MNKKEELEILYDKNVFGINKLPYRSYFNIYKNMSEYKNKKSSLVKNLNGKWDVKYFDGKNDKYEEILDVTEEVVVVATPDKIGKVKVPCCLEFEGFGEMQYVNSQYPWDGIENVKMGEYTYERNSYCELTREFLCPEKMDMKKPGEILKLNKEYQYILNFDGIEGHAFIYVNDEFVGYTENSFSPSSFDVTKLIGPKNKIMVRIYKRGTASYLEDQDFWRFTGIFRDVKLIKLPKENIFDIKVDYELADDYSNAEVVASIKWNDVVDEKEEEIKLSNSVKDTVKTVINNKKKSSYHEFEYAYVLSDKSQKEYGVSSGDNIRFTISNPKLWSAETPYVYTLFIKVKGEETYLISLEFGIRDFKMQNGIMTLNGKRIVFKGVNRHEFSGFSGRAISRDEMLEDVITMKKLNINAVRTSHYPNSPYFYSLCNRFGLYVIDESNLETHGSWMQAQTIDATNRIPGDDESYNEIVLDRARSLYERDKNQPCVLIWSCGNESNGGKIINNMTKFFKENDSKRLVHYEGIFHDRTFADTSDMESQMYTKPQDIEKYLNDNPVKPFICCEYMHAMGNSLGGMKLYTDLEKYDKYQGGFIWDFIDQNIIRDGKVLYGGDFNDRPNDYNFCGDGIVFADRSLSPKVYEVKKLYQNIKIVPDEEGVLIKNENLFVDTSEYIFVLDILKNGILYFEEEFESVIEAGTEKYLSYKMLLSEAFTEVEIDNASFEYTYRVSAVLKNDKKWVKSGYEVAYGENTFGTFLTSKNFNKDFKVINGDYNLGVNCGNISYLFSKQIGRITSIRKNNKELLRYPPLPIYSRATTDNDRGNGFDFKSGIYKLASFEQVPIDMEVTMNENSITIMYTYKMWAFMEGLSKVSYTVNSDGSMDVTMKYLGTNLSPDIPEFGIELPIAKEFDRAWFYGKGPHENYIDRNEGTKLGVFDLVVNEELTPYARPQECGNRTGVRKLQILDKEENALTFEMINEPFEFSFLPNATREIDGANHIHELPVSDANYLKILAKQMGVGGDDSWGAPVHDQYLIDGRQDIEFSFRIY